MAQRVDICGIDTSSIPKLKADEVADLMRRLKHGDNEARQMFLYTNMRLVLSIVKRFATKKDNVDDIFQVGFVGLIKAMDNFDENFNVKFSTYAVPMIIGEIRRFLRAYTRNFLYLGRGYNYPVALEGALKLKEISYIHAEGYPAAEMKHGPIALIDEEMPVVVIAPKRGNYEKILSNIQEVKARKGRIISVVTEGDTDVKALSDWSFEIPDSEECFEPILSIIPLQLLAYHIAIAKGRNVDQPRNLAKSVTVE